MIDEPVTWGNDKSITQMAADLWILLDNGGLLANTQDVVQL
jgi:hypothetical protein